MDLTEFMSETLNGVGLGGLAAVDGVGGLKALDGHRRAMAALRT